MARGMVLQRGTLANFWGSVPQPARGILIDSKYQPPILTKVGYDYVPIITMLPVMLHITMFQVKCLF